MSAALLGGFALAAAPLGLLIGLGFWTRWLARRTTAPTYAALVGYAVACLASAPILWGLGKAVVAAIGSGLESADERRRVLAMVIAQVFYGDLLGSVVALAGSVWLAFWTWRSRRKAV
jgi:glucose dehydrogenase